MSSFFFDYLSPAWCIKGKNGYNMENYIDQIEKFLKGQMSQEEEGAFKTSLRGDAHLRSFAIIVVYMLKEQK